MLHLGPGDGYYTVPHNDLKPCIVDGCPIMTGLQTAVGDGTRKMQERRGGGGVQYRSE
jgi:hypothetical protein